MELPPSPLPSSFQLGEESFTRFLTRKRRGKYRRTLIMRKSYVRPSPWLAGYEPLDHRTIKLANLLDRRRRCVEAKRFLNTFQPSDVLLLPFSQRLHNAHPSKVRWCDGCRALCAGCLCKLLATITASNLGIGKGCW